MCISLGTELGAFAAEDPRDTAIKVISHAAAAVAVLAGAPTDWRLRQILTAVELFEQEWFVLAIDQARRAELPIEEIPDKERGMTCPQPFGAVLHAVRRLKDAASPAPARNAFFAMALAAA
jgi:hypothetical protein